jgi:hypothetical protein
MSLNLAKFGYSIRYSDSERCGALNMAIKEHGRSRVLDCLEHTRNNSAVYGCRRACTNIAQKIEQLHLKMTERDIAYVMERGKKPTESENYINAQRSMAQIAMKFRY